MRRAVATTATLAVAALVLSACGTTADTESATAPSPTATAELTPESPEATAEPTASAQPTTEAAQTEEPVALPAAFDFDAPTVDGGTFQGASLLGQDSVLYFWAPWCTTCRAEAPGLPAVADDFDGQATFYGVAGLSPDVSAMQSFVTDTGTGDLTHIADTDGSVYTGFGVSSQTTFAFVNDDGSFEIVRGPLSPDEVRARTQALIDS